MRLALTALGGAALFIPAIAFAQPAPPAPAAPSPAADAASPKPGEPPPPPPTPGAGQPESEAPANAPSPFGNGDEGGNQEELAGFRGGFFIRDRRDYFRLFPEAWLGVDLNTSFGPGVGKLPDTLGGHDVSTKLELSHARFGLEGEILRRWDFMLSVDVGGQPISNVAALTESSAGKAGQTPTAQTSTYAPAQTASASAAPADVWLDYHLCNCFSVMIGQFNAPIGIENRTPDPFTPLRERNLAIRTFVAPGSKDLGAMAFGYFGERFFNYELGAFQGDGPNRPGVDSNFNFVGRLFVRPLAGRGAGDFGRTAQIGLSTRLGQRDPAHVAYDVSPITTAQGFALWRPTYVDSLGRVVHVIPSSGQTVFGGELRFEVSRFSLQSEAYFVDDNTREAVDGFQLTNTERLGHLHGAGWYAQLSAWPLGDAFVRPEPGMIQPRQLDLHAVPGRPRRGLEVLGIVSGIDARYDGASRKGVLDPAAPASKIELYQVGFAAQYWHTQHIRFAVEYDLYVAPGSGGSNGTVVPDNLVSAKNGMAGNGHVLHELGGRLALAL